MKKLLLAIFIIASCSKKDNPEIQLTEMKVVESVSNIPVSDAKLIFIRCAGGCNMGGVHKFEGMTDENGMIKVPTTVYNDSSLTLNVVKPNYWKFDGQRSPVVSINPHGWINVRARMVGNYPAGAILLMYVQDQFATRTDVIGFYVTTDTVFSIKAYGAETNRIVWEVTDEQINVFAGGTLNNLNIPKFDTLKNVTLDY